MSFIIVLNKSGHVCHVPSVDIISDSLSLILNFVKLFVYTLRFMEIIALLLFNIIYYDSVLPMPFLSTVYVQWLHLCHDLPEMNWCHMWNIMIYNNWQKVSRMLYDWQVVCVIFLKTCSFLFVQRSRGNDDKSTSKSYIERRAISYSTVQRFGQRIWSYKRERSARA